MGRRVKNTKRRRPDPPGRRLFRLPAGLSRQARWPPAAPPPPAAAYFAAGSTADRLVRTSSSTGSCAARACETAASI